MSQSNSNSRSFHSGRSVGADSTLLSDTDTDFNNTDVDSSSTFLMSSALSTTNIDSDSENKVTKGMIEKKQLIHDIELIRIELSQKNLMIDNLKVEYMNKVDELEEKVSENRHAKLMLQARLESQLKLQQEESQSKLERMRRELNTIMSRQQLLERENERLLEKAGDLRQEIDIEVLTGERYLELKTANPEQVSLKDFVSVKVYEAAHPYKVECESLHQQVEVLSRQLLSKEEDVAVFQKEAEQERLSRSEIEYRAQRLSLQVEELKSKLEQGDYKKSNFDNVRGERDSLDREVMELRKSNIVLEASLKSKVDELQEYQKEMQSTKQSLALLKQDKEYLNKQVQELSTRCTMAEDHLQQTTKELNTTKQAREELYEKYITTREQYKSEYEIKLKNELDNIGSKTNTELDQIRSDTRDMYERENKSLREVRDNALHEKDRARNSENEVTARYDQLLSEFRQLQVSADSKQSELQNELKLKQFEIDRLQILYDESSQSLKQLKLDYEKCSKKNEVLLQEFYTLQHKSDKQISSLETERKDKTEKLKVYENLEQELDDVIMQSAEIVNEVDAEKFLNSYGYGANVPSTAKRRMQQSVHLARRVLQLERANTSLRNDLERETSKRDELQDELTSAQSLLNEAKQPYKYLIESIQTRDNQNQSLQQELSTLKDDLKNLKQQKEELTRIKNLMSADLERLLNQREEISHIKHTLLEVDASQSNRPQTTHRPQPRVKPSKTSDVNIITPKPTVFTKSEPPNWYRKLKQKLGEPQDDESL